MYQLEKHKPESEPWNKGKLMDQELSLTLQDIWSIRIRLQNAGRYLMREILHTVGLPLDSQVASLQMLQLGSSGRLLFWAGYRHSLNARVIGMDWTTVTAMLAAAWLVVTFF